MAGLLHAFVEANRHDHKVECFAGETIVLPSSFRKTKVNGDSACLPAVGVEYVRPYHTTYHIFLQTHCTTNQSQKISHGHVLLPDRPKIFSTSMFRYGKEPKNCLQAHVLTAMPSKIIFGPLVANNKRRLPWPRCASSGAGLCFCLGLWVWCWGGGFCGGNGRFPYICCD